MYVSSYNIVIFFKKNKNYDNIKNKMKSWNST